MFGLTPPISNPADQHLQRLAAQHVSGTPLSTSFALACRVSSFALSSAQVRTTDRARKPFIAFDRRCPSTQQRLAAQHFRDPSCLLSVARHVLGPAPPLSGPAAQHPSGLPAYRHVFGPAARHVLGPVDSHSSGLLSASPALAFISQSLAMCSAHPLLAPAACRSPLLNTSLPVSCRF